MHNQHPSYENDRPARSPDRTSFNWEREVIANIASESLNEQRKARRWGVFFKILGFAYITGALLMVRGNFEFSFATPEQHTAIVDVTGPIANDKPASAHRIIKGVKAALEDELTAGVVIRINTPGGSPVESGRVFDEIIRLRDEYDTPIIAVIQEIGASGGYYIASAADEIYADKASLVGSIGVRSGGFGFVETLNMLGVERRLITSGNNKAFLDPFAPVKLDEVQHMENLLESIHQQFKTAVKTGRGDRLTSTDEVFSGLIWTGEQALDIGLIDNIGNEMSIARDLFNAETLVNFTPSEGLVSQLTKGVGVSIADRIFSKLSGFDIN